MAALMKPRFTWREWALGSAAMASPVLALGVLSVWAKPATTGIWLCVYLFGLIVVGRRSKGAAV
jgi:hypothetical protein